MNQTVLPYLAAPVTRERYLDDLHSAPAAAPFTFEKLSADDIQLLHRRQLRRAGEARGDVSKFFEFVYREEQTRAPIVTAAHQRLVFQFARAFRTSVIRLPRGFSKTYCMSALGLFDLGRDVTTRGMYVSAAESQAVKPLLASRMPIESSPELRLVFPKLKPSERDVEPWTQTAFTVDRPYGIRDPSMVAVGLDSKKVTGTRLNWLNIDDILDVENTHTDESRQKVNTWVRGTALPCVDLRTGRVVCTNTPWHPQDLTYSLEALGWPSLTMDCWGGITLVNADSFDSDELRPTKDAAQEEAETGKIPDRCRLAVHDRAAYSFAAVVRDADDKPEAPMEPRGSIEWVEDEHERVPLWPEVWDSSRLYEMKRDMGGGVEWARAYELTTSSDVDAKVQDSWIDACKANAFARGYRSIFSRTPSEGEGHAFTGVDLGFGKQRKSGNVAIFSFCVLPDMRRLLLDVDVMKYKGGKHTIGKVREHHDKFGSVVAIESNAAQRLLKEWALDLDISMRVTSFETNKNKNAPDFGVESIFLELENAAWLIPSSARGQVKPDVQMWLTDMKNYRRGAHTGDALMACWIARERARLSGALRKGKDFWGTNGVGAAVAGIMTR